MYYDQIETWYDVYKSDLKMCFGFITSHICPILGQKSWFSTPLLAQFQIIKMPDFYI